MKNKRFFTTILATLAIASISVQAQSKLDLHSRAILRSERGTHSTIIPSSDGKAMIKSKRASASHVTGFVTVHNPAAIDSLQSHGVTVFAHRGDIALVAIPINSVENIATLDCVKSVELSHTVSPQMDVTRKAVGADKIHAGTLLPQAYTGNNVVTGIVDGGLDPNHINFLNEDGSSRIVYLSHIYETSSSTQGYRIDEYYTPEKIASFTTDNADSYHGTHTLGIMAGGYKGSGTYALTKDKMFASVATIANPYYGMAPSSEIVASCGTLADMFIALGIENILNYRYAVNKPAVINLSLGNNTGPHDGTSTICRYLSLAAKEAVICIASGNSGDQPIVLSHSFTPESPKVQTFIAQGTPVEGYNNLRYGQVYVYSQDESEFTIKMVIYNKTRKKIIFELPIATSTDGEAVYYASPDYAESGDKTHVNFTKAFKGYVGMGSMYDPDNGRYYALLDYMVEDNQDTNADSNYILGFVAEGSDGQRIDAYCDGAFSKLSSCEQEGWSDGSPNGSVSNMATADGVIVVGSYNTRDSWPAIDGYQYSYQGAYPANEISSFSSYGTLADGRELPHVCAPGATIVSSGSLYYVEYPGYEIPSGMVQGKVSGDNRNHYWMQSVGTSMACPVVAGGIALWLEADPSLTVDDVKDIIASTSVVDDDVRNTGTAVQWGAGKFDAYAGLKEVIRRSASVGSINSDNRLMVKSMGNGLFSIFNGGAASVNASLFSLSGQCVLNASSQGDELTIDASALTPGCYILNANGQSQKIIIK